jgi:hypothetical protein
VNCFGAFLTILSTIIAKNNEFWVYTLAITVMMSINGMQALTQAIVQKLGHDELTKVEGHANIKLPEYNGFFRLAYGIGILAHALIYQLFIQFSDKTDANLWYNRLEALLSIVIYAAAAHTFKMKFSEDQHTENFDSEHHQKGPA